MKYIFLEKTGKEESSFYKEYLYFITDNEDFNYSKLSNTEKSLIHFKVSTTQFNISNFEISVEHNSPNGFESTFGNIYLFFLHNKLSEEPILKFTVDNDNNIIKVEQYEAAEK